MKRPFPIIDAEGHVIENIQQFREFLPSQFHGEEGKNEYVLFPRDGWARGALTPRKHEHPDAARWLEFLDACARCLTTVQSSRFRKFNEKAFLSKLCRYLRPDVREVHVRFWEGMAAKFCRATQL